jgi:hypothetical protein
MNLKRRLFLKLFAITGAAFFTNPLYAFQVKREVPATVNDLYAAMSSALPVGDSTSIRWSVTGEEYVEYALGLYVDEAVKRGHNPETTLCAPMWRTFLMQLARLENPSAAKLYWRVKPEIAFYEEDVEPFSGFPLDGSAIGRKKARIYLRYLISSKPAKFTQDFMLNNWNYNNTWNPVNGR